MLIPAFAISPNATDTSSIEKPREPATGAHIWNAYPSCSTEVLLCVAVVAKISQNFPASEAE